MIEEIRDFFPWVWKKLIDVNFYLPFCKCFIEYALYQLFLITLESWLLNFSLASWLVEFCRDLGAWGHHIIIEAEDYVWLSPFHLFVHVPPLVTNLRIFDEVLK
jgi:hypothetical protein